MLVAGIPFRLLTLVCRLTSAEYRVRLILIHSSSEIGKTMRSFFVEHESVSCSYLRSYFGKRDPRDVTDDVLLLYENALDCRKRSRRFIDCLTGRHRLVIT